MGSELGLDLKLSAMKSVTGFLKDASAADDAGGRDARLEDYVRSLEEEKRKIEAFRRELPLSVLLITDVIRGLSEELEQCRGARRTLEEFMPMKGKLEEEGGVKPEKDTRDKMNWMSSAQLWSDNYTNDDNSSKDSNNDNAKRKPEERDDEADRRHESKNACMESKPRIGGAFLPFKASSINGLSARKDEKVASVVPDLSLVSPPIRSCSRPVSDVDDDNRCGGGGGGGGGGAASKGAGRAPSAVGAQLGLQAQQQPPRKARRCWSPELHRRFVVALQQLGGAQVATPKQIRELMKVDGLTNDEVKSHLQKYRLHTRRVPNSSGAAAANRPVVVMGGLWVPQDHYTSSQQSASQSGSPQGPLQLAGSARAVSVTAGDSYEEEDGKSESYSWK